MKLLDATGTPINASVSQERVWQNFKQIGTSPIESVYLVNHSASSVALSTGAPAIDVIHCVPFPVIRARTLESLQINVTTLAVAGVAKLLLFGNAGIDAGYPGSFISAGSGEVSTATTGVKVVTFNTALSANTVYWAAYWTGTLAATLRCAVAANCLGDIGGFDNTLPTTPSVGWQVAQGYSSASNPVGAFPIGSAARITAAPFVAIFAKYAA